MATLWFDREGEPIAGFRHLPSDGRFRGVLADALRGRNATILATDGMQNLVVGVGARPAR